MKKSLTFKKIISPILVLPCLFLFASSQSNNLETKSTKDIPYKMQDYTKDIVFQDSIEQIASGSYHSGAVIHDDKTNGDYLYTWGSNANGQLGIGEDSDGDSITPHPIPKKVVFPKENVIPGTPITQVSMAYDQSAALINNQIYMWGNNYSGQIGDDKFGYDNEATSPKLIVFDSDTLNKNMTIEQIALGASEAGAILNDGTTDHLYMWGRNDQGQLGKTNAELDKTWPGNLYRSPNPEEVTSINDQFPNQNINIEQISMGYEHSAAVINDGTSDHLYTWGLNDKGQLGHDNDDKTVDDVAGDNKSIFNPTPQEVFFEEDDVSIEGEIKQISMGEDNGAAIINDDTGDHLYTWGDNTDGQLGLGDTTPKEGPEEVVFDSKSKDNDIKQISMGGDRRDDTYKTGSNGHSAAIVNNGISDHLYTWGSNDEHQLGLNNSANPDTTFPQDASFKDKSSDAIIKNVDLGSASSLVLVEDGNNNSLYTVGGDLYGELGPNNDQDETTNSEIFSPTLVTQYLSNVETKIIVDKDSNFETATLEYWFDTNVDTNISDVAIKSNPDNEVAVTIDLFESGNLKPIETRLSTASSEKSNNSYYGSETFNNLEKNKEYTYKITITYLDYDIELYNGVKTPEPTTIANVEFVNHLHFWYQSTWFFSLVGIMSFAIILAIGLFFYWGYKKRRKVN